MTHKIVVFGNSELATTIYSYLTNDSPYEVVAFTTDAKYIDNETLLGLPVVPFENVEELYSPDKHAMDIFLGFRDVNRLRAAKYDAAKAKGYELISYICSQAMVWPDVPIGDNCHVFEAAVVQPYASVGDNVVVGPGSVIGHHSQVRDHCFLATHTTILGNSVIEPYCVLGANATVLDGVTVARECIIGAGSVITKDTRERGVYVSKPAELLSKPSDEIGAMLTWSNDAKRSAAETPVGQSPKGEQAE